MKHKHAGLLHYAAENADAKFYTANGNMEYSLDAMLHASALNPSWVWHICPTRLKQPKYLYVYKICGKLELTYDRPIGECIGKIEVRDD